MNGNGNGQPGVMEVLVGITGEPAIPTPLQEQLDTLYVREREAYVKMLEATLTYTGSFVDPLDAIRGDDGELWTRLGGEADTASSVSMEQQLTEIRNACRKLADLNEYAINGHENRISYIVGTGHIYLVVAKQGEKVAEDAIADCQAVLDEFFQVNKWQQRQQEIVRRKDRDGECFLRFFQQDDQAVRLRFVEPGQVATPTEASGNPHHNMGIITNPDDVETVEGYYIDGQLVEAAEIQHRKANVDFNVKRGLPLFHPVRKTLGRAESIQRGMAVVAEIQSKIAMIRKHTGGTAAGLAQFVQSNADVSVTNQATGDTTYHKKYRDGTILDANAGIDYEFPSHKVNPAVFVQVIACLLRAVASRLVMPEFMLTSDASNANYASTMVAEGPAVKMFERLQHDMIEDDLEVMDRVLDGAVATGQITAEIREKIKVSVTPPNLASRDRKAETEADAILVQNEAMSSQEMSRRHGLDPGQMAEEIEEKTGKLEPFSTDGDFVGKPKADDDDEDGPEDKGNETEEAEIIIAVQDGLESDLMAVAKDFNLSPSEVAVIRARYAAELNDDITAFSAPDS